MFKHVMIFRDMETGEEWSLHATSADFKRLFKLLGIIDRGDQRHPPFAKCLLTVIQCSAIVDEINLLSKREVVLPTNFSSQGDQKKSEPIHVQVICRQGTLKLNGKVCRTKVAITHMLHYMLNLHILRLLFCYRMLQTRSHSFIQLLEIWLKSYVFAGNQFM